MFTNPILLYRCGGRFDEGARITFEKDQTLCDSCKISESKQQGSEHLCASCNLQIVGTTIFAMEQEWHMNCFTCQVGQRRATLLIIHSREKYMTGGKYRRDFQKKAMSSEFSENRLVRYISLDFRDLVYYLVTPCFRSVRHL